MSQNARGVIKIEGFKEGGCNLRGWGPWSPWDPKTAPPPLTLERGRSEEGARKEQGRSEEGARKERGRSKEGAR